MNANLRDLRDTPLNLKGIINLPGYGWLTDKEIRLVAIKGLDAGYETLEDVSDEWAVNLLNERKHGNK